MPQKKKIVDDQRFDKRTQIELTNRRRVFLRASHHGDLVASVAALVPLVRELFIYSGVDGDWLIQQVHRLVMESEDARPAEWQEYCDALNAAYALGLAMGQQIAPGFFKTGGAK